MSFRGVLAVVFMVLTIMPCRATTSLALAHIYEPEHHTAKACLRFADAVKARSQGRLVVKVYGEASMGNQAAITKSMKNGSLDLAILNQGVLSSIVPEANAFGMPFLFPDSASAWRVLDGPVGQQFVHKLASKGLVVLSFWDVEMRHISNSVRPILKPADLVGLRIRTPPDPLTADVISALGGKPVEINFSELRKALQQGVVDGQDNPLINVQTSRLYDVQKFISLTGHKVSIHSFLITQQAWGGLSAADREIVLTAAKEATHYLRELTRNAEAAAYRDLVARGMRIDKVDSKPFIAATANTYDKWYASPIGDFVRAVVKAAREKP